MWVYINGQLAYKNVDSIIKYPDTFKDDNLTKGLITLVFEDSTKKDIEVKKFWIAYPDFEIGTLHRNYYCGHDPIKAYLYT